MLTNCKDLKKLSDELFREEVKKYLENPIEGEINDCIVNELKNRDLVIKISKDFVPFVSKVIRSGKTQQEFAKKYGGKRGLSKK